MSTARSIRPGRDHLSGICPLITRLLAAVDKRSVMVLAVGGNPLRFFQLVPEFIGGAMRFGGWKSVAHQTVCEYLNVFQFRLQIWVSRAHEGSACISEATVYSASGRARLELTRSGSVVAPQSSSADAEMAQRRLLCR